MMKRIIIIGGGFAGLWAALGAARKRFELNQVDSLEILLINKTLFHDIRVRNYEDDLEITRIPLGKILASVNVKFLPAEVQQINISDQSLLLKKIDSDELTKYHYDRLVLAAGSQLYLPAIPGLVEYSFNIDCYAAAKKLQNHLNNLPQLENSLGRYTVVVIGGGFTGLELVAELPSRVSAIAAQTNQQSAVRIILIDTAEIASTLGDSPQKTILSALKKLNIEMLPHTQVVELRKNGVTLKSGEIIATQTVIWTAGMRANRLTKLFTDAKDPFDRIIVDEYLRMPTSVKCFAAGDVACAKVDDTHMSVMSCQHGRPQGRIVGHNVVADLYNFPLIAYSQQKYVTCLDLGSWGALYMEGWERSIRYNGDKAKKIKRYINHERIYPPTTGKMRDLLEAAAPYTQNLSIDSLIK